MWWTSRRRWRGPRGGDCSLPLQAETASSHRLGASGKQRPHGKLEETNAFFKATEFIIVCYTAQKTHAVCIHVPVLILVYWFEHLRGALMFYHVDYKAWTKYLIAVYEVEMSEFPWHNVKRKNLKIQGDEYINRLNCLNHPLTITLRGTAEYFSHQGIDVCVHKHAWEALCWCHCSQEMPTGDINVKTDALASVGLLGFKHRCWWLTFRDYVSSLQQEKWVNKVFWCMVDLLRNLLAYIGG